MAKKKTNAKVVSKAKAPKAKKTTKRSKTSAKSAAKTELIKQTQTSVADATQENSNLESDLKISKFAKAPAVQETDEVVADDLMTLNQKLNQIFDKKQTELSSTDEPAPEPTKPKATRINLEPVSAEMIEKSAEASAFRQSLEGNNLTAEKIPIDNRRSDFRPEATNSFESQTASIEAVNDGDEITVHVKTIKAETASQFDDQTESTESQWNDELSDEAAERLAIELDELDNQPDLTSGESISGDNNEPNLGAIVLSDSESAKITKRPVFRLRIWMLLMGLMMIGTFITWRLMVYQNVSVDGREYYTQSADQIAAQVIGQYKDHQISLKLDNQAELDFKLSDLGIGVDAEKLIARINQRRQLNINNLIIGAEIRVPLMVDYPVLQSSLDQYYKEKLINPTDAVVVYNRDKNKFETKPSVSGYRVDARTVIPDASKINFNNKPLIPVKYQSVEPLTRETDLIAAENYLNERLKLRLNLNHNGKLLYFADPWDIADWVVMRPNAVTNKITIDFDKQKIQDFIKKTVSPEIARGVINKKVLINDQGQVLQVLQHGQRGLGAVNPGNSAEKIRQALLDNQNLEHDLDIQEIDFVEERIPISGLKWIEVNLTKQTTTLYSGEQALQTFTISSGVHPWPTPTGTYKVWFKNRIQRMRGGSREAGDYYDLPNVRWNTYFNRDIGFHTAYWHNNFGRPMSHGCINMREADAKVVFDFAPIGTMVVVKR